MKELVAKSQEYDYIFVCEAEYIKWLRREKLLLSSGIEKEKILPTMVLDFSNERIFKSPLDDFLDMKKSSKVCALVCAIQDMHFGNIFSRRVLQIQSLESVLYNSAQTVNRTAHINVSADNINFISCCNIA